MKTTAAKVGFLLLAGSSSWTISGTQASPAVAAWSRVLAGFVRDGGLDYAALKADRSDLDEFLASLEQVELSDWTVLERIAFWCNAYNAVVVHHVLDRFPGLSLVTEVDGFFDELRFPVAGRSMTLDEIESAARELGDPRVHFAVVCASTSCPDLRDEPYRPERLDVQLAEDTRRFLSDPAKGLRWDPDSNTLHLSSIFKWYAGDFTGGSTVVAFFARGRVLGWLLPHLPGALAAELEHRGPKIRYLDYDWSLNDRSRPAGR